MAVTKDDLVNAVYKKIKGTRSQAVEAVDIVLETMKKVHHCDTGATKDMAGAR